MDTSRPVLGVDLGTSKMSLATAAPHTPNEPRVVTTPGGMKSVPPMVSFRGKARYVGEAAAMQSRSNADNTVTDLAWYIGNTLPTVEAAAKTGHAAERFRRWTLTAAADAATVQYNGAAKDFDLRTCASMLLRQARDFSEAGARREAGGASKSSSSASSSAASSSSSSASSTPVSAQIAVAVPDAYTDAQVTAVCDAARMAQLEVVSLAKTSEALAASFASGRFQASRSQQQQAENIILFVDIGHTFTSVSVTRFASEADANAASMWSSSSRHPSYEILAVQSSAALGARDVDAALFGVVTDALSAKGHGVDARSKAGAAVLRECEKAKKVLSTIPSTEIFFEQFGGLRVKLKRSDVEQACSGLMEELRKIVELTLDTAGVARSDLTAVEMSGGGSRVPCFRDTVSAVIQSQSQLTTTLSPEAVAQGAATAGAIFLAATAAARGEQERRVREKARRKAAAEAAARQKELFEQAAALKKAEEDMKAAKDAAAENVEAGEQGKMGEEDESGTKGETEAAGAAAAAPEAEEAAATTPAPAPEAEPAPAAAPEPAAETDPEPELPPVVLPTSNVPATALADGALEASLAEEAEMCRVDAELRRIEDSRNALESFIYEMQSAVQGRGKWSHHASLLDREKFEPLLDEAQRELWDAPEDAGAELFETSLQKLRKAFDEGAPAYFEAVQKEKEAEDEAMRKAEKEAEAERKANGEDDEDHDRRKLKSADRMRLVMRNKDEATELFKGKNYAHAAARYTKSLGHCSKFVDMTPEVKAEVEKVKLSLYLNLAQCYLKLEAWAKVIPNCKDALSFDPDNVKALYRRAYALIKLKQIDDANKDLKKGLKLKPDDKSLLKLKKIVDASIKKAKAKEKKMAQAMFGGN